MKIGVATLRAYAQLHDRGVLHGDVHPNNVLVSDDDTVHIIDFGRARVIDDDGQAGAVPRGGAAFYFDPEYAAALLAGVGPPPVEPVSEQYCVAVLLRELLVGRPYLDFSLNRDRMLQQIVEDRPVPFVRHGVTAWPDLERALETALAKRPMERFASVIDFAEALERAGPPIAPVPLQMRRMPDLFFEVMSKVARDGSDFAALKNGTALCSVNSGAAGIAYALYRIASVREDAAILALAELWIDGAERRVGDDGAFFRPELGLTPPMVGRASLFHSPSGLACVDGLIALSLGDLARATHAVESFVARSQVLCDRLDLTLGRSGQLLGCAALLPALPPDACGAARAAIVAHGDSLDASLRQALRAVPTTGDAETLNLGIAHGWAGALFALLRWREVNSRGGPDPEIEAYLSSIALQAETLGEGLRWQWKNPHSGPGKFMAGWCNGSAGMVHLWTLAERMLEREEFGQIARRAALNAYEEPAEIGDLCCGAAGRAYAMLDMFRHTGDGDWLERANTLAGRAVELSCHGTLLRNSLYKGEVGIALLFADLERPRLACMPLFDREP